MDQISRLVFDVVGRDRGGSKVLNDSAVAADRAHAGFSKLSGSLSGLGGPFDQATMLAGNLGAALDGTLGRAQKLGLGLTAAGVALVAFGAKDQQARRQLQQTIQNTGDAEADYRKQIEETIKAQEHNAHTADDTENALNTLTIATQDTSRSLSEMGFVADIAATKHESLAEAADQLVKAQAGNTRAFKSFGIVLDDTLPKSEAIDKALQQLQDRLSGQASASVDTFTGHLKVWGVELENDLARLGKFGPEIALAGAALTVYASTLQVMAARKIAEAATTTAETRAETANAAARLATAEAANLEAAAIGRVTAAQAGGVIGNGMGAAVPGALAIAGRVAVPAALAYGAYQTYKYQTAQNAQGLSHGEVDMLRRIEQEKNVGVAQSLLKGGGGDAAFNAELKRFIASTKTAGDETKKAGRESDQYATSLLHEADAAAQAARSLDARIKALQDSTGSALNLSAAEDGLQGAMHNLAQSVHDGNRALTGHSLAAESNRDALRALVKQELDVIAAMRAQGIGAEKVRATAIAMSKAIERNAADLLDNKHAVDVFLESLGVLPSQIELALGGVETYSESIGRAISDSLARGIDEDASRAVQAAQRVRANVEAAIAGKSARYGYAVDDVQGSFTAKQPTKQQKAAKDYGDKVAHDVVSGYAPAVDTGIDQATSDALEKAKQRLERMKQLEKQTFSEVAGYYRQTRQQIVESFNITSLPQGVDILGASGSAGSIKHQAREFAKDLETWAHLYHRLERRGLNEVMLQQLEQAGVAAIPAMREILHGGAHEIHSLNRSEHRIRAAGAKVAATQTEDVFGKQLTHVMRKLPHDLAHELAKELRRLHIITDTDKQDHKNGQHVRAH